MLLGECLAQQVQDSIKSPLSSGSDGQRRLYYGKEYFVPPVNINGTRSFKDLNFVDHCTIVYEGIEYNDVMLMYDIVMDEVIVRDPDLAVNVHVIRPHIARFSLNEDEFIQVFDDTEGLNPGFYYKIYDSENFTVYGVSRKRIQEYTSLTARERRVIETVHLFLKPKDSPLFVPITGRRNFLRNFGSDRKEINRYMREKAVLYRDDPKGYVQSVLHFVDEIKER